MKRCAFILVCVLCFGVGQMFPPLSVDAAPVELVLVQSAVLGQVDVTDPAAILFVNETVRPLSERARALYYECKAAVPDFVAVASEIPTGGGTIEDGRDVEGVSRLSCDDVRVITTFLSTYIDAYEGVAEVNIPKMAKPCVRRLSVN